ncbi:hypothetical protein J3Q64DRAFT_1375215 [Phycomyces blakesleeanus]|uniref:Uncharacterized protein n=1 Tax=Phycomyces blakesleeanus TaxID=4837 RepID=A0ABR3AIW9_PHYBL
MFFCQFFSDCFLLSTLRIYILSVLALIAIKPCLSLYLTLQPPSSLAYNIHVRWLFELKTKIMIIEYHPKPNC